PRDPVEDFVLRVHQEADLRGAGVAPARMVELVRTGKRAVHQNVSGKNSRDVVVTKGNVVKSYTALHPLHSLSPAVAFEAIIWDAELRFYSVPMFDQEVPTCDRFDVHHSLRLHDPHVLMVAQVRVRDRVGQEQHRIRDLLLRLRLLLETG